MTSRSVARRDEGTPNSAGAPLDLQGRGGCRSRQHLNGRRQVTANQCMTLGRWNARRVQTAAPISSNVTTTGATPRVTAFRVHLPRPWTQAAHTASPVHSGRNRRWNQWRASNSIAGYPVKKRMNAVNAMPEPRRQAPRDGHGGERHTRHQHAGYVQQAVNRTSDEVGPRDPPNQSLHQSNRKGSPQDREHRAICVRDDVRGKGRAQSRMNNSPEARSYSGAQRFGGSTASTRFA